MKKRDAFLTNCTMGAWFVKYYFLLPLSALIAVSIFSVLVSGGAVPSGEALLTLLQSYLHNYFYALIFLIILLEAIVYIGFYFPGQFFAVILVVLDKPDATDMLALTACMVAAATLGSLINFALGKQFGKPGNESGSVRLSSLLLAMIHINSLAFFMFSQGANNRSVNVVWLAGLLNLPYYLMLIAATSYLSEEVMQVAESTALLFALLLIWLVAALYLDIKRNGLRFRLA